MEAECSGYSRYSKWAGSPWRNQGNEIQQRERKDAYILHHELSVPGNLS